MNNQSLSVNNKSKVFSLTFMQVVSALAVVTLHTNGCFWDFSATERYWLTANIIEGICYFAVPVFFMITGITLLDYHDRYSTKIYFKKRIEKTLIPYIAWSLIGVIFLIVTKKVIPDSSTIKWVINGILTTDGIINVYWFFRALFCVYLSIPLFAAVKKEKNVFGYLVLACFIVNMLIPFLNSVLKLGLEWPYRIDSAYNYLFWVLGGYYVYKWPPGRKLKSIIYIAAVLGLLTHIAGTYILSIKTGSIQTVFKDYNNIPCVLYTFGVYCFLKDIGDKINKIELLKHAVEFAGKYTFPLYLIHWFVIQILIRLFAINTRSIIYRLIAPLIIFGIVIGITEIISHIPIIKRIVP